MNFVYLLTYAVVLWHTWCLLTRESLILNEIRVRLSQMCCVFTLADGEKRRRFDVKVKEHMVELKLYQTRVILAIGSFALAIVLAQIIMFIEPNAITVCLLSSMLVFYIACLAFTFTILPLTSQVADLLANAFMIGIIFRIVLLHDVTYFFLLSGVRASMRLVGSLVFLDIRKVIPWNIIISIITFLKYTGTLGVMDQQEPNNLSVFLFVEITVFMVVLLVAGLVQYLLDGRMRAMLEVEGARRGMHKLLGTLCDAVLNLGPELRITTPTPQFLHMLGRHHVGTGSDVQDVEGTEFITHIASELDRQRFQAFISASTTLTSWLPDSSSDAASSESGPPAVLHLHLQDAKGLQFPVEVFHAYLPDAERQPGHLLGIRVVGEQLPAEASEAADCSIFEQVTSIAPGFLEKSPRRRPSSRRSSKSANSWESVPTWQRIPLRELAEVSFCVDAFDPRLRIFTCTLRFVKDEEGTSDYDIPGLLDWIVGKSQAKQFQNFLQTHLNRVAEGSIADTRVGPLVLQPSALVLDRNVHFVSDLVTFSAEGPESDEEASDNDNDSSWPVILKLQNLNHLQKVYTRRLKKPNMSPVIEGEGGNIVGSSPRDSCLDSQECRDIKLASFK